LIKVLELFSGVGSFSISLNTLGIEHEIVGFSETRKTATQLFCKLHNKKESENLGDVRNVSAKDLDVDLLVFGSPCQSFTRAGKQGGGLKGSDTRSALMWEAVRIMEECKPKWIVWENVPDAISRKNMPNFQNYMDELDSLNYNTYYKVLNAHELGSAQKRKRLFSISIRKDIDNGKFEFLDLTTEPKHLETYLENSDQPDIANEHIHSHLILGKDENGYKIKNGTKQGYLYANNGDGIDLAYVTSKARRGRVQVKACQTIMRGKTLGTINDGVLRFYSPREYWRLQEMPDELYKHVEACNFKPSTAYDVVGGVINQLHLKTVFLSLKKAFNW